jgi:DNA (cytosine-5)-methyltransferase 1
VFDVAPILVQLGLLRQCQFVDEARGCPPQPGRQGSGILTTGVHIESNRDSSLIHLCSLMFEWPMKIGVVDLFCGIGGLSYGFKSEGFDVIAGIDSDDSCRFAYETNIGAEFIGWPIEDATAGQISNLYSKRQSSFRVLIGCAPCTPFSIYVGKYRKNGRLSKNVGSYRRKERRSPEWQLLREFLRLVCAVRPDVVSMENVPRLTRHAIFKHFVRTLQSEGYTVNYSIVRAHHYGVPQRRARLVLFASLLGVVCLPNPTHLGRPKTVRDAIGNLPEIKAGETCASDCVHASRGLSKRNLERLKATREGGSWRDWRPNLRLKCHTKRRGQSFRSVYGRMRWDEPSPVITTQCLGIGNGRFGHPTQHRAISIREAALLQSFPKKFRLIPPSDPISGLQLARQIGNAVPVRLARVIARAIKHHLVQASA